MKILNVKTSDSEFEDLLHEPLEELVDEDTCDSINSLLLHLLDELLPAPSFIALDLLDLKNGDIGLLELELELELLSLFLKCDM